LDGVAEEGTGARNLDEGREVKVAGHIAGLQEFHPETDLHLPPHYDTPPDHPVLEPVVHPHGRSPFVSRTAVECKGNRSARADRASGRCRAGAGFAWRLSRSGRFFLCWRFPTWDDLSHRVFSRTDLKPVLLWPGSAFHRGQPLLPLLPPDGIQ